MTSHKLVSKLAAAQEVALVAKQEEQKLNIAVSELMMLQKEIANNQDKTKTVEYEISRLEDTLSGKDPSERVYDELMIKRSEMNAILKDLRRERETLEMKLSALEEQEQEEDGGEGKNFDKKLCIANIRFLLSVMPIKLGDIEREAGVSVGYLSRLEKEGNTSDPSIEFLVTAAKMFDITLDTLLYTKLNTLSVDEKYLIQFLTMLKADTDADKVVWSVDRVETLNSYTGMPGDYDKPHPLFSLYGDNSSDLEYRYHSAFLPNDAIILSGPGYHAVVPEWDDEIYLMKFALENPADGFDGEFIEVYHVDKDGKVFPICNTTQTARQITDTVNALYDRAGISATHIHFADATRSLINGYLTSKIVG